MAAILVVGLGVGIATSLLQPELRAPWLSLANAASPWLTPMFFLGAFRRRPWGAALVGATTGLLELLGFFAIAAVRGDASAHSLVLFWVACALLGGPIFGLAGWLWWRGPRVLSAFGGALLPAAFFAEAAVIYGWRLHYLPSAILFVAVGVGVLLLLGLRGWQHGPIALWLLVAFPAGVVAELLVGMAYSQAF
jgi:hypothetical protein